MRRSFINTAFVIAVAAVISATAAGQSGAGAAQAGRVSGTVFDPNGAVIVGANVYFESSGRWRHLSTNDEGFYQTELPNGTYALFVGARGFCPSRKTGLHVAPGTLTTFDVTLRVAETVDYRRRGGLKVPMLVDAVTDRPCTLETPAPAPGANAAPPPLSLASMQARKPSNAPVAKKPAAKAPAKPSVPAGTVTLSTQPGAVVWVDEVRRGVADAGGKLQLKLTPGRHSLRVRAKGFAERTLALLPTQRGALPVVLTKTTDEAELLFQQAEEAREKGNNAGAVELYRQALGKRARYAAAHLGLARSLESQENFDEALEELQAARRDRPVYPESWAVEGRIQRSLADHEAALAAYRRALREARGFQPEAHTGMGIAYEDKGRYEEAVEAFRKAVAQLSDTEPVLYELLARNLERLERWKEAVAAYEKYLELAPQGAHASAVNSIIDQLRKQAAEAEQQTPPLD
ncbi:MAG TPA: carboxypeptidase regulatory-like domain-containing protein [Pyrinomonadaceae bacterium]